MTRTFRSWSHLLPARSAEVAGQAGWLAQLREGSCRIAPRGAGRSFGDAAYAAQGQVTCAAPAPDGAWLRARIAGLAAVTAPSLTVPAGLALGDLHRMLAVHGLSFPVFGGTQWATVGGATAGDIHGKNHREVGSFGNHVAGLTLVTGRGDTLSCGPGDNPDVFRATIGGMGMTGYISDVTLRLRRQAARSLTAEYRTLGDLEAVHDWLKRGEAEALFVSWPDLAATRPTAIGFRATAGTQLCELPRPLRHVPVPRLPLVNATTARAAAALCRRWLQDAPGVDRHSFAVHYAGVHESIHGWNRLFPIGGMIEYHFACPLDRFAALLGDLRRQARAAGLPLLCAVAKPFGSVPPVGDLSFARDGIGLNFQMPWSQTSVRFLRAYTDAVLAAGGRINLTKDAVIMPDHYARATPELDRWRAKLDAIDPARRVETALGRRLRLRG